MKVPQGNAMRWEKLRNWLNNLMTQESVTKTEKKGITIALNIMDRIEEGDEQ
jgi:hypothetical protein